jgi:membrane fusion protein, multidrug efflux system
LSNIFINSASMIKKYKNIIITAVIIVLIVILLIIPKIRSSNEVSPATGRQMGSPIGVSAHLIKSETLENNVLTTGTVMANEEVELRSEIPGKIVRILFNEGSPVKKGDLLVKINDEELKAQLERARYRFRLLEDREYRQKVLLEREAISQEDYDVSLNELNMAKSEVDLIIAQINKTEIKAPFDGKIGLKSVSEGSFVNNSIIIATLQNINPVKIDFSVPEKYYLQVQKGDKVNFTVTGSNERFVAEVYALEPKIDPVTRTLRIRAIFRNDQGRILPGSFADVQLVLKQVSNAILIPTQSVIPELKGQKVFLYKNGNAVPQNIETGTRTEESVQVTSGLKENDTLITSGILQLRPGMPVSISRFN